MKQLLGDLPFFVCTNGIRYRLPFLSVEFRVPHHAEIFYLYYQVVSQVPVSEDVTLVCHVAFACARIVKMTSRTTHCGHDGTWQDAGSEKFISVFLIVKTVFYRNSHGMVRTWYQGPGSRSRCSHFIHMVTCRMRKSWDIMRSNKFRVAFIACCRVNIGCFASSWYPEYNCRCIKYYRYLLGVGMHDSTLLKILAIRLHFGTISTIHRLVLIKLIPLLLFVRNNNTTFAHFCRKSR